MSSKNMFSDYIGIRRISENFVGVAFQAEAGGAIPQSELKLYADEHGSLLYTRDELQILGSQDGLAIKDQILINKALHELDAHEAAYPHKSIREQLELNTLNLN